MKYRISKVAEEDQGRAVACLTAAFLADPFMRWMLPDAEQYLQAFPLMTRAGFGHSRAFATADLSGVAQWMPPGMLADEVGTEEFIRQWVEPGKQEELGEVSAKIGEYHPDGDSWFLPAIGVDPFYQRQGIGGALLQHGLRKVDAAALPAYLVASNPMNRSLYERHGFRTIGCVEVGSVPSVYPMLRSARSR